MASAGLTQSLSHTHTITQTHTGGDIIATCQVCSWWPAVWHWVWAASVCIPCSLCAKGAPYSLASAASLALNHRTRWCTRSHTHARMRAHTFTTPLFALCVVRPMERMKGGQTRGQRNTKKGQLWVTLNFRSVKTRTDIEQSPRSRGDSNIEIFFTVSHHRRGPAYVLWLKVT